MSREWNGGQVWAEFAKTAAEEGLITSDLTPEQEHIENRQKEVPTGDDYTRAPKTEDYKEEDGRALIEKAHPEDAQVASAMGKGGLVENQVQQQEKSVEIAQKMPNGALHGVHASTIRELVKLANDLEDAGKTAAAMRIDAAIMEVQSLPFDGGHLRKEAFIMPILKGLAWLGGSLLSGLFLSGPKYSNKKQFGLKGALLGAGTIAGLKMFGGKLTTTQDNLATDLKDLHELLIDSADESKSAAKAAQLVGPYAQKGQEINMSDEEGLEQFRAFTASVGKMIGPLGRLIASTKQDYQMGLWEKAKSLVSLQSTERIESAYEDLNKSYAQALNISGKGKEMKNAVSQKVKALKSTQKDIPQNEVSQLQNILFAQGYKGNTWSGDVTGEMDKNTVAAAKQLERMLSRDLQGILAEEGMRSDFTGKIVRDNQVVIDLQHLETILELAEREV